ncbi:hypothetical protein DLAC_02310 [Tieghemostelium lacteum]|uniref:Lipid-binding serum glycoprotein C-terminal domain-containing protein n=1 Tax=Tieghemostelium lacteum TaxID=361077 RepID=A0A152A4M4_TIELA|nr:hypothetical protein DLAC_02310 [Tieghemostelium lacteum]|eukprot:KYR01193.1 hypothetical protein DLAC_02310 [Tieghemostelium lacteum]
MKYIILSILLFISLVVCQPGEVISSGLYVGINSNFLQTFTLEATTNIQNYINSMKLADISGSDGHIKYQITSIQQSVTLKDFFYKQYQSSFDYAVGFNDVSFTIHTDYQVCYKIGINKQLEICEHGKVTIQSTATISLYSNITLDFYSSQTTVKSTGTLMNVPSKGISYSVSCDSRVCDKTGEIRDKIQDAFVPDVQTSITNGINTNSEKFESLFPNLRPLNYKTTSGDSFLLNSEGILVESNGKSSNPLTPTMIMNLQGGIVVSTSKGGLHYPSQTPIFKPEFSDLEDFTSDMQFTLCPFLFESFVGAMFFSDLPMEFTPKEVPPASPVTLNTSDPFFLQSVPGLAKYPNQPITVQLSETDILPTVIINSTGLTVNGTMLRGDFIFPMDGKPQTAFSVQFIMDIELKLAVTLLRTGEVNISSTIVNMVPNAYEIGSQVGQVDVTGFIQLLQLFASVAKVPTFTLQNPTKYPITSIDLTYSNQYIQLNTNFKSSTLDLKKQFSIN